METTFYQSGKPVLRRLTQVERWQVNEHLDAAIFLDVIPADTQVSDAKRNATSRQPEPPAGK